MKLVKTSLLNENLSDNKLELTLGDISKLPLSFFNNEVCSEIEDILNGVFGFENGHFYVEDLKANRNISFLWDDILKNGTSIMVPKGLDSRVPSYLYSLRTPDIRFMSDKNVFNEHTTLLEAFELIFAEL